MTYQVERLQDLPALLVKFDEDDIVSEIIEKLIEKVFAIFEASEEPLYYITDARKLKMSFNDIMSSLQYTTRGSQAILKHPKMKQLVVISESKAIATTVKGLNSVSFGNINAIVFETLEAALQYVRQAA
jgi:hypothetical protein